MKQLVKSLCVTFCLGISVTSTVGQIITTVAGNGSNGYDGDGSAATSASIGYAGILSVDNYHSYYFSELNNTIRKVDGAGIISKYAGNGLAGFSGDGGPATAAQFDFTGGGGIAFDSANNMYVADQANNRIRKIDFLTGIVSTVVGNGTSGFSGDGGSALSAALNSPAIIAFDAVGNMYIVDALNFRIRKVSVVGIISTIAGNGTVGFSGDGGPATNANISNFGGLCISEDNVALYFGDGIRVRKVNLSTGIISTIAGNGITGFAGDGGPASAAAFYGTQDVQIDKLGRIYISDKNNHRIRMINTSGIVNTIAGNGGTGFSGDGGPATAAEIYSPRGIALDTCGNLLVVDNGNRRIRKIAFNPDCLPISVKDVRSNEAINVTLHPNPVTETLTITAGVEIETVAILNTVGQVVETSPRPSPREREVLLDVSYLPPGVYMVRVNEVWVGKMVKQ